MTDLRKGLLILDFGGHARSVADVALHGGIRELLFVDRNARADERFLGFEVRRQFEGPLPAGWQCFAAAGDNVRRQTQISEATKHGWTLASIISQTATIGRGARLSEGCFVGHHAHVGPMADVGEGAILNTGSIVEHDCSIGAFAHVSVNATVAGRGRLGAFSFLGAGAIIIDNCEVGDHITVGAGAVVVKSIAESGVYVGAPARLSKALKP